MGSGFGLKGHEFAGFAGSTGEFFEGAVGQNPVGGKPGSAKQPRVIDGGRRDGKRLDPPCSNACEVLQDRIGGRLAAGALTVKRESADQVALKRHAVEVAAHLCFK